MNKDNKVKEIKITKRNGTSESINLDKIYKSISTSSEGLEGVDTLDVARRTISGIYEGDTTEKIDKISIQTASNLISTNPDYSYLATILLSKYIKKEVVNGGINTFSDFISSGHTSGLISKSTLDFVNRNKDLLNKLIDEDKDRLFNFFGLKVLYDRYLLRDPITRKVIETPQYFFLRISCGLNIEHESNGKIIEEDIKSVMKFYNLISSLEYLPSTPTLFNSGTNSSQMSSCYLLDSPEDDLKDIFKRYSDIAMISKFAGGIGVAYSRVRSRGSAIKGTNGRSNGIVSWLKVLDSSVVAVNQGGKRKGAACVYLESWHADIEEFLELKNNTGSESFRTHNLNLANWIPDIFMERVRDNKKWTLFDPSIVPHFVDMYGDDFKKAYEKAEHNKLGVKEIDARYLYKKMLVTLAQTGNGWMCFKDSANKKCNQTDKDNVVHLSNLCTEILEVTNSEETAVCNLGSINLSKFIKEKGGKKSFNFKKLSDVVKIAVAHLDKVIDLNFYPIEEASVSNKHWRPIGLGVMGLQDVFFKLRLPFESEEALELSNTIAEEIYYSALQASVELAQKNGKHFNFEKTKTAKGILQMDLWESNKESNKDWSSLRKDIVKHGLRNSLLIAIAPTATIASIAGCYECIEPQVANIFKRETLSGDFIQINKYLIHDLQKLDLWDSKMKNRILANEGSIQEISAIPLDIRNLYKTAWEIPQKVLIDLAAGRSRFIDQSQSLNLFVAEPKIEKLSSMYMHAWQKGLKTTYYLRSKAATNINQVSVETSQDDLECSLENPEYCESCQ